MILTLAYNPDNPDNPQVDIDDLAFGKTRIEAYWLLIKKMGSSLLPHATPCMPFPLKIKVVLDPNSLPPHANLTENPKKLALRQLKLDQSLWQAILRHRMTSGVYCTSSHISIHLSLSLSFFFSLSFNNSEYIPIHTPSSVSLC